jgi:hypothetical protein
LPAQSPSPARSVLDQPYQAIVLPGSSAQADSILKIEIATGKTWVHCCSTNNMIYYSVSDAAPPPPGDYHILGWAHFDANGSRTWEAYRFDDKTGRSWALLGGAGVPPNYRWIEINQTK